MDRPVALSETESVLIDNYDVGYDHQLSIGNPVEISMTEQKWKDLATTDLQEEWLMKCTRVKRKWDSLEPV